MEMEQESTLFESKLEEWRKLYTGSFVLIKGDQLVGVFPTLSEAFSEGLNRFGLENFFVKQITPRNNVNVSLLGRSLHASNSL
jgi:hypothetical protein